jgi:hypothetical protein
MVRALAPRKSDMRSQKRYPKNNAFCYRWRVIDNFNKTVERELFDLHLSGGAYHQSLQNERILALYKMTYRRNKSDFISKLTQDAMSFLDNRRSVLSKQVQEESAYTKSMAMIVDSLFNIVLSCSIELNTVLGFSELFVAATEPEVETYTSNGQSKVRSLHFRFSTSTFGLVVHGQKNRINFYVVPIEELFGSKNPSSAHEPIASCTGGLVDDDVQWTMEVPDFNPNDPYAPATTKTHELTEDAMEAVCHYALRYLIEATQKTLAHNVPVQI